MKARGWKRVELRTVCHCKQRGKPDFLDAEGELRKTQRQAVQVQQLVATTTVGCAGKECSVALQDVEICFCIAAPVKESGGRHSDGHEYVLMP